MKVRVDSDLRRNTQGTALIGGSPTRLFRLSGAGARLLDAWLAGAPIGDEPGASKLAERLLDAGMIHPVVSAGTTGLEAETVGVVIPVFNDVIGLQVTLDAVRREVPAAPIVVVDDGSDEAEAVATVADASRARVVYHEVNRGPAAARNTGWRSLVDELGAEAVIVFIDADVKPEAGSLELLCAHLRSKQVGVVAPRVKAALGNSVIDAYEAVRSPLDLGTEPARVRAGSRVSYVPAAALVVRANVLTEVDGFDESMRSGEDVDFVWRVDRAGWQVRYEPAALTSHRNRRSLSALALQRRTYGLAAGDLAERHGGDVAPVAASRPMLATWALLIFGPPIGKAAATLAAAGMARQLQQRLATYSDDPTADALHLSTRAHLSLGRWLATASTRAWLPALAATAVVSSRARHWLLVSIVAPAAADWLAKRPALDPLRFTALRLFDDAAYCAGVVQGAVDRRSIKAFMPRVLPSGFRPAESAASA